jgi:hypothetical protein
MKSRDGASEFPVTRSGAKFMRCHPFPALRNARAGTYSPADHGMANRDVLAVSTSEGGTSKQSSFSPGIFAANFRRRFSSPFICGAIVARFSTGH